MKFNGYTKLLVALLFIGLFSIQTKAQTWGNLNSGITDNINQVVFFDNQNGFAVADAGRIIRTSDGGATWLLQSSGTVENLNSIHYMNAFTAIAVGNNGIILKTTDGGNSWNTIPSGTSEDLMKIEILDANNAYAVGTTGIIIKTTDSGNTWNGLTSGTTENLNAVYANNANAVYAVGEGLINSTILVSFNSGINWSSQNSGTPNNLNDVHFTSNNNGFATGELGTVLMTTDGGTNWMLQTSGTSSLNDVFFLNDSIGYICGANGTIKTTNDSGTTWIDLTSGTTTNLTSIYFTDPYTGYAAGDGGLILKTCPTVNFTTSSSDTVCEGTMVTFTNQSFAANSYTWVVENDTVSTQQNMVFTFDTAATYWVELIAENEACQSSTSEMFNVVNSPEVDLGNDTVICNSCSVTLDAGSADAYAWYQDGNFTGNVSQTHVASSAGTYVVEVTNSFGCMGYDTIVVNMANGIADLTNEIQLVVYPNPSNGQINITIKEDIDKTNYAISIFNNLGQQVYQRNFQTKNIMLDLTNFPKGIYTIQIGGNETTKGATRRIVLH